MSKLNIIGNVLIVVGVVVLLLVFGPAAKEEVKYQARQIEKTANVGTIITPWEASPPNIDFSIVIPKIEAKAAIISDVDPANKDEYLKALRRGVAHAKGSSLPGMGGNIYLFAHSTDSFYNVNTFNAVFYLIGKLTNGDEIEVYYKGEKIRYEVYSKLVVEPDASEYFGKISDAETLTLQTCYPPGTTLKRLIVLAKKLN